MTDFEPFMMRSGLIGDDLNITDKAFLLASSDIFADFVFDACDLIQEHNKNTNPGKIGKELMKDILKFLVLEPGQIGQELNRILNQYFEIQNDDDFISTNLVNRVFAKVEFYKQQLTNRIPTHDIVDAMLRTHHEYHGDDKEENEDEHEEEHEEEDNEEDEHEEEHEEEDNEEEDNEEENEKEDNEEDEKENLSCVCTLCSKISLYREMTQFGGFVEDPRNPFIYRLVQSLQKMQDM